MTVQTVASRLVCPDCGGPKDRKSVTCRRCVPGKYPLEVRRRALELHKQGLPAWKIAKEVGARESRTVRRWINPELGRRRGAIRKGIEERLVSTDCAACGNSFQITHNTIQKRKREGKRDPLCPECRRHGEREVKVTHELKQWWLERYTPEQIRQLSSGLEMWFS